MDIPDQRTIRIVNIILEWMIIILRTLTSCLSPALETKKPSPVWSIPGEIEDKRSKEKVVDIIQWIGNYREAHDLFSGFEVQLKKTRA
jgi:hypothetical protein